MPFYLGQYMGKGTDREPFRPVGSDQPGWSAIDLRADASRTDGGGLNACLLYLPSANADARLRLIALDPNDTLTGGLKTLVSCVLRKTVTATRFKDGCGELLLLPPNKSWNALLPHRLRNRYELWLNGLLWSQPVLSGGSLPATDTFVRADANPISGNWTVGAGAGVKNLQIYLNRVTGTSDYSVDYWNADSFADDQYAQATVAFVPLDGAGGGPAIRIRTATQSDLYYLFAWQSDATFTYLAKKVNGANTNIASLGVNYTTTNVLKIDGVGTTITGYKNGSTMGSPVTDTSLTSGSAGLFSIGASATSDFWAPWEGGNVGAVVGMPTLVGRRFSLAGPRGLAG